MRLFMIALIMVLTFFQGDYSNEKISRPQKELMKVYNDDVEFVDNILPQLPEHKYRSEIFYAQNDNVELLLYCDSLEMFMYDTGSTYTHLLINGTDYVLDSFGKSFNLRQVSNPKLIWYDINKDGETDFALDCGCDRYGMLQYVFVSTDEGSYKNIGSVSWDTNGIGEMSYEKFPYTVRLHDEFKVEIGLPSAGISEIYSLNHKHGDFLDYVAIPLGLYDANGKVTDLGKTWDFISNGLYESEINYQIINDELIMIVKSYINAGYSTSNIDCGFVFAWKVSEDGYELLNVTTFMD